MNGHDPDKQDTDAAAGSRALFERSVDRLDVGTGNRLRLMRRKALSGVKPARPAWLIPAGGAGMALLLVGVAWWSPQGVAPDRDSAGTTAIAADGADTAFPSDDDAELYAWLGDAPVAVDKDQAGRL